MTKTKNLVLLTSLLLPVSLLGQNTGILEAPVSELLVNKISLYENLDVETEFGNFLQNIETPKKKSVKLAALFSAIIPGAGQFYRGGRLRGLSFLAVEAGFIWGREHFNGEGEDIEREFISYADKYWNEAVYKAWESTLPPGTILTHDLPNFKSQQYYEMIGKYNQFLSGWPDTGGDPEQSQMRLDYMARRKDSNDKFKTATMLTNFMVVNRIVSVAEVLLVAKLRSNNFKPSFRFKRPYSGSNMVPTLNLKFSR